MNLDSAALTAGLLTETSARKTRHGARAVFVDRLCRRLHRTVAFGVALDAFGRSLQAGWTAAFVTLACGVGFGRWAIGRIGASPPSGCDSK
jgi:small-conductance mechanosensitive channel